VRKLNLPDLPLTVNLSEKDKSPHLSSCNPCYLAYGPKPLLTPVFLIHFSISEIGEYLGIKIEKGDV
jgi:hypothetical protein